MTFPVDSQRRRLRSVFGLPFAGLPLAGLLFVLLFAPRSSSGQTLLTLHDAIEQAKAGPLARQGQDRVDAAYGSVKQAGIRPNPRLYLQSEDLRPWAGDFDFPNATEDYAYLTQTFETDRKRAKRIAVANANVRRSEAERILLDRQIAGRVAGAYWAVVTSTRIKTLLEEDRTAVDEMVRYHKERVDAGAMRGVDLLRMQIERDRLEIALQAARREMALAWIGLSRQVGRTLDPKTELTDSIDTVIPVELQTVAAVLAARADVAAARETVALAQAEIKLQKALGVPDLDLTGGYKRNTGADTLYTSLLIQLPFRNRNQGEVQRAEANLRLAQDELLQVEASVRADVQAAQEDYTRQKETVATTLPDIRGRAQQNLAILSDAYKSGGIDLLRYIDAERTAIDVEVGALRALAEYQQSALRLTLAYGGQP